MATPPLPTLAERLGLSAGDLAPFTACSDGELRSLDASVRATLEREDEAVDSGLRATLKALPRPLRGRAKSLLFPGEDA